MRQTGVFCLNFAAECSNWTNFNLIVHHAKYFPTKIKIQLSFIDTATNTSRKTKFRMKTTKHGFLFSFFKKSLEDTSPFLVGPDLYPSFGLLVTSPLGFKARVCNLIRAWCRRTKQISFPSTKCLWCKRKVRTTKSADYWVASDGHQPQWTRMPWSWQFVHPKEKLNYFTNQQVLLLC